MMVQKTRHEILYVIWQERINILQIFHKAEIEGTKMRFCLV